MYITLESDYAVRIVSELAAAGGRLDAKTISERTSVTLRFALKILRKLVMSGVVVSFKGTQGGYELADTPDHITLNQVIEAVEGKYVFSRCLNEECECSRGAKAYCKFREIFADISELVEDKMNQITFNDLK